MRSTRGSVLVAVVAAVFVSVVPARAQGPEVAVVTLVEGQVSTSPGERPVRLFEWVAADTRLATGPRSTLVLTFANGTRIQINQRTKAVVLSGQVQTLAGTVVNLPPVPAFPARSLGPTGGPAAPTDAQKAARKQFIDSLGQTADPVLLVLAAAVDLHWGETAEAAELIQRAKAAKAPPKMIEALEKRVVR